MKPSEKTFAEILQSLNDKYDMDSSEEKTDIEKEMELLWNNMDNDNKLLLTKYIGRVIVEHATEGGTYRRLIYDRLGFGPEAYGFLIGEYLTISNEFIITDELDEDQLTKKYEELCDKIPIYLSEEDKIKFNFNTDRSVLFEFFYKLLSINKELKKQEERYNRLMEEYKKLLSEKF